METKIGPDLRKPFRGLTTIQLFDKNTGELLEEYHDENTYNDRLQYTNYLDTVLKCKGPNTASVTDFLRIVPDTLSGYSTFYQSLYYTNLGDGYDTEPVRQLFATLWLTDTTKAETAHGYPNGCPVGIADACGNNAGFNALLCTGALNISESYVGNDRLHLVFDFATDRCNVQFDAIWLYPSCSRFKPDTATNTSYAYAISNFLQATTLTEETLSTTLLTKYPYITHTTRINGTYSAIFYSSSSSEEYATFNAIQVFNNVTGDIVATYDFDTAKINAAPFYYDVSLNTLYVIKHYSNTNPSYVLGLAHDYDSLYAINLTDGSYTRVGYLYDLLNLRWATFNSVESDTSAECDFLELHFMSGSTNLMFRLRTTDASTGEPTYWIAILQFDALTRSFSFVKKIQVYSNPVANRQNIMLDGILISAMQVDKSASSVNKYSAIDVATGSIKCSNILSPTFSIITTLRSSSVRSDSYQYARGTIYIQDDFGIYKRDLCLTLSNNNTSGNKVIKRKYFTAPWSTHNKLTSAIKKTDLTTMKIQYDIVWDSIPDVILPALL